MKIYPLAFEPVYKDYIWGGKRIIEKYAREPQENIVAESWEVCDHKDGMSVVQNGEYQGKTLHALVEEMGADLLGEVKADRFPLLIKLIDSHQRLSVQVHPDDETAQRLNAEPKSEMWYVLEKSDQASVLAGFKKNSSKEEFTQAIKDKKLLSLIEKHVVKTDEAIYIPGGTIHAVMEGCLLLEVQQNSNTTYRIFDWHRGRELHEKEAIESLHYEKNDQIKREPKLVRDEKGTKVFSLIDSPYFKIERIETDHPYVIEDFHKSFQVFFALGAPSIIKVDGEREMLVPGKTILVPAGAKKTEIKPTSKPIQFLRITV